MELTPLGKNRGGYRGESIAIQELLHAGAEAVRRRADDWVSSVVAQAHGFPIPAYSKAKGASVICGNSPLRIYLSAGIHGDEPAGPLAAMELLTEYPWPDGVAPVILPCLNPAGFDLNRREDPDGLDLNRQYRRPRAQQVADHVRWLDEQPQFDVAICLHEDWEAKGFYLYELRKNCQGDDVAMEAINAVRSICPIDLSPEIEGRPARGGRVTPIFELNERPEWPEAFYLASLGVPWIYTLEAPSDYALPIRVRALARAVDCLVRGILRLQHRQDNKHSRNLR